jgi:hypothetical protein
MHSPIRQRILRMKKCSATIAEDLAFIEAWKKAVALAYYERTGLDLAEGGKYSAADSARANEFMEQYRLEAHN